MKKRGHRGRDGRTARFPPFTTREKNPTSYGEEAPLWPVVEIPKSARDHLELLMELMDSPR